MVALAGWPGEHNAMTALPAMWWPPLACALMLPLPQDVPKSAAPAPAREAAAGARTVRPEDEKALKALVEAFLKAYNAGDAKTLADQFTEDAEVIDVDGTRHEGRSLIEQMFQQTFS